MTPVYKFNVISASGKDLGKAEITNMTDLELLHIKLKELCKKSSKYVFTLGYLIIDFEHQNIILYDDYIE